MYNVRLFRTTTTNPPPHKEYMLMKIKTRSSVSFYFHLLAKYGTQDKLSENRENSYSRTILPRERPGK
jgi:hypothetical protein